jgi:hypothetical protein
MTREENNKVPKAASFAPVEGKFRSKYSFMERSADWPCAGTEVLNDCKKKSKNKCMK